MLFGIERRRLPRLDVPAGRAIARRRFGGSPGGWGCAWRRSATARKSASCPTRTMPGSSANGAASSTRPARSSPPFDLQVSIKEGLTKWGKISAEQMWSNIEYFQKAVIPAAEKAGVQMALHPDDPPVPGVARDCAHLHQRGKLPPDYEYCAEPDEWRDP